MNIDKILESKLISKGTLAKLMYPNIKYPAQYLDKKIKGKERQTLNYKDRQLIKQIITELIQ